MVRVFKYAGVLICAAAVILMTAWGALAIWYSNLAGGYVRAGLAGLFVLATLLAFVFFPGGCGPWPGFSWSLPASWPGG